MTFQEIWMESLATMLVFMIPLMLAYLFTRCRFRWDLKKVILLTVLCALTLVLEYQFSFTMISELFIVVMQFVCFMWLIEMPILQKFTLYIFVVAVDPFLYLVVKILYGQAFDMNENRGWHDLVVALILFLFVAGVTFSM